MQNPKTGKWTFQRGQYVKHKAEGSIWVVTGCWLDVFGRSETYHVEEMDRIYPRRDKFEREELVPVARVVTYVEVDE